MSRPDEVRATAIFQAVRPFLSAAASHADVVAAIEALLAASQARALSSGEGEVQDILRAVAHVGVDFGFGPYVLDDTIIAAARALLDPHPPSKDNTNE